MLRTWIRQLAMKWSRKQDGSRTAKHNVPSTRLQVECLESRELLSGTPWSISTLVNTYDQGVVAVQSPLGNLVRQQLGALPMLKETLSDALGLSADIQAPFQTNLKLPAATDAALALQNLATQLQQPGFSVQYLNTTPEVGTNDLMRVSYSGQWRPSVAFDVGAATGISYLDAAQGRLSGVLQAGFQPTVNVQITFGVDVLNSAPTFYLKDSSSLTAQAVNIQGSASGSLTIGSLANIQASGTISAFLQGCLGFKNAPSGDHKLRLSELSPLATFGGVNGSMTIGTTFSTSLPLVSTISWSGNWTATLQNGQPPVWSGAGVTLPDANGLIKDFLNNVAGSDILTRAGAFLGADKLPVVGQTVSDLLGIPGLSIPTPFISQDNLRQFINGSPIDLIYLDTGELTQSHPIGFTIPIFGFGIPVIATVDVKLSAGMNLDWAYRFRAGIDSRGFYVSNLSHVSAGVTPYFGVKGSANVIGGLFGADIEGRFSFPIRAQVGFAGPTAGDDRIHMSSAADFLRDIQASLTIDEQFDLTLHLSAFWGLISDTETLAHQSSRILNLSLINGAQISQHYGYGDTNDYHLLPNGDLQTSIYKTEGGKNLQTIDTNVKAFVRASDDTVYVLKSDGTVYHNLGRHFQNPFTGDMYLVSQNGQYVLGGSGDVVDVPVRGDVRAITNGPSQQSFYVLTTNDELYSYSPDGTSRLVETGVQSIVQPAGSSGFFLLQGSNLCWYEAGQDKQLIESGVQAIAFGTDGVLYVQKLNGVVKRNQSGSWMSDLDSDVRSLTIGADGMVYVLKLNGDVKRYQNGAGWISNLDTFVQTLAIGTDGMVYVQKINGDVKRYQNGIGWIANLDSGAQKLAIGTDGMVYVQKFTGEVKRYQNGSGWISLLDTNVQTLAIGTDGMVYVQKFTGEVKRYQNGSGWISLLDTNVQTLAVGSDGTVYVQKFNGDVKRYQIGSGWISLLDTNVQSLAIGTDGTVYVQKFTGEVKRYQNGSGWISLLDTNVQTLAIGTDGMVYVQKLSGDVKRYLNGIGWYSNLDTGVQKLAIGTDGMVYVQKLNGDVKRYQNGLGWFSLLDSGVQTLAIGTDGMVYVQKSNGDVKRYQNGSGWISLLDTGVQTLAIGTDGMVYVQKLNGDVKRYLNGTGWFSNLDVGVKTLSIGRDGIVYVLTSNGDVKRYVNGQGWISALASSVQSLSVGADGIVYVLKLDGSVARFSTVTGAWIDNLNSGGVRSMTIDLAGVLCEVKQDGSVARYSTITGTWL